jgi:murein DD-endopeptidase MepM/ murein hydrolase activator NlpD
VILAALVALVDRVTESGPSAAVVAAVNAPAVTDDTIPFLRPSTVLTTVPSILVRHQVEAEAIAQPVAAAEAEAVEAAEAAVVEEPQLQPAYFTYTVQEGDTVSSIATAFNIEPDYIMWNNPEMGADPDLLLVGANVLVPSVNGLVYHVTLGDTLSGIASYYQIDVQNVVGFLPNGLSSPDAVTEGMVLVLPGGVPPPPIPAAVEVVESTAPAPALAPPPAAADPVPPSPAPPAVTGYAWPYYGNVTTYFGEPRASGYHRGVDLDGFGNYGAPIGAAADGVVALAAWNDWGLGYHVIVEHTDGSRTTYGHLSEIWVSQGQYVSQGEAVGSLGSSGYSTGPHLHFELWLGGGPVDPLLYLP